MLDLIDASFDVQHVTIHGYRRAFVKAGSGPALLLLHGLACDHHTWDRVIAPLAENFTVIAPDFLGHGDSDKPRADYSIGGYANGMRDLLTVLGIDKVTVVGHSFGGGVAMQFGYQFPERTERMILVSSGGLGPEVTPAIRAITLPGFQQVAAALTMPGVRQVARAMLHSLKASGHHVFHDFDEVAAILESWRDPRTRRAIQHLVRNCVDLRGQIITMRDRAYLTAAMPMALAWGANDQVIPSSHLDVADTLSMDVKVQVFENSGHFPHRDHPEAFVEFVRDFVGATAPAVYRRANVRRLLLTGGNTTAVEQKRRQLRVLPNVTAG